MTDFHVCPKALRTQANEIRYCSGHYNSSAQHIGEHRMGDYALGVFGRDIADVFNDVLADVHDKLMKGKVTIESAGNGLAACANIYESVDAAYYREFGYIDESVGY
ncbi:hypothetical protein [Nocardia sp. SC052]|uniref:hypothetical protein n=1 Tax=Nocardia sichangensis TaxID=3385975 RepID=UPI0039A3907E